MGGEFEMKVGSLSMMKGKSEQEMGNLNLVPECAGSFNLRCEEFEH